MVITDIKVTTSKGQVSFSNCETPNLQIATPALSIWHFMTALKTPLGMVIAEPGMIIEFSPHQITSSQTNDEGFVELKSEAADLKEIE